MADSRYTMTFDVEDKEYVLLNPGEYEFTIDSREYGDFNGSLKLPACGKVTIHFHIDAPEGTAYLKKDFFVCKEGSGVIAAFCKSIGDLKDGQKTFQPDWDNMVGKKGRVKITQREYNGNMYNNVDRFVAPKKKAKKAVRELEW